MLLQQQQQQQQQQRLRANLSAPPTRSQRGETIHDYIWRTETVNDRLRRLETDLQRIRRLDRERHATTFECPGTNGAAVFEWQELEGIKIRTYVTRSVVPGVWSSYADSQRWYNGHRNEWDLCVDLDPNARIEDDEEYYEEYFEDGDDEHHPNTDLQTLTRLEVEDIYTNSPPLTFNIRVPSLEDMVFHRFGFHYNGQPYPAPSNVLDEDRVARIEPYQPLSD